MSGSITPAIAHFPDVRAEEVDGRQQRQRLHRDHDPSAALEYVGVNTSHDRAVASIQVPVIETPWPAQ